MRACVESHEVEEQAVSDRIAALLGGVSVGHSHRGKGTGPIEITVRPPKDAQFLSERLLSTPVPAPGPAAASRASSSWATWCRCTTNKHPIRFSGAMADLVGVAAGVRATRCYTWLLSNFATLSAETTRWVDDQFQWIAWLLADYGLRFGLEPLGPAPFHADLRFTFLYPM